MYPLYDRNLIVCADFEADRWLWSATEGEKPEGLAYGELVGYGVFSDVQFDLYRWFDEGREALLQGTFDANAFHKTGRELAKTLSDQSLGRFTVGYGKDRLNLEQIPFEYTLESEWNLFPFENHARAGKMTICFGKTEGGIVKMAFLCTSFYQEYIANLSDTYDPIPDFVDLFSRIAAGGDGCTVRMNEEGHYSFLTIRNRDNDELEFIVEEEKGYRIERRSFAFINTCILARVNRRELLAEFYRRITDFIEHDYVRDEWHRRYCIDDYGELEDDCPEDDLRNLDLSAIKKYLETAILPEGCGDQ
jgi:hypothetical protein